MSGPRPAVLISEVCDEVKAMLLAKKCTLREFVFSKASPVEQLLVRLDDKLSRLSRGSGVDDEDVYDKMLAKLADTPDLLEIWSKRGSRCRQEPSSRCSSWSRKRRRMESNEQA